MPRPKKIKPTKKSVTKPKGETSALKAQVQKLRIEVKNANTRIDTMTSSLMALAIIVQRLEEATSKVEDSAAVTLSSEAPQAEGSVVAATPDGSGLVEADHDDAHTEI